ncbi:MAG: alpha/beta hydrolase [Chloroflexota bacterium]|nr:alpha/beta hydrolase [Chloroflexota bacterium]
MGNVEFRSGTLRIAGELFLPNAARFPPPYPAVVICHGIGSRKENQSGFAGFMAQHGFAALCFDFRGHGESEGQLDDHPLDDVSAAIDLIAGREEVDRSRLALRGSSMGGMLALHAAARDRRVQAIAAIAPAVEAATAEWIEAGWLQALLAREHLSARIDAPAYGRYLRAHNARAEISHLAPRALLLVHCRGDELIPYTSSEELFALAREPKQLRLIEQGHHRFAQQDAGVHKTTLEWFQTYLEPAKEDFHDRF